MSITGIISQPLISALENARNQVCIGTGWLNLIGHQVLSVLISNDVHVTWLLGEEEEIKKDFSRFNHLLELKKKGFDLLFLPYSNTDNYVWIDHSQVYNGDTGVFLESSRDIAEAFVRKRKRITEGALFFPENDDIKISFEAGNNMIFSGDEVEVSWEVNHADKVELFGVGEVDRLGHKSFKLADDSFFKLKAHNGLQTAYSTIYIGVNKQADVDYDIGFLNKRSQKYDSLIRSGNYSDVFGAAKGSKLKFSWSVTNCESVFIEPFGFNIEKGEYEFEVQENVIIEIVTQGALKEFRKKIFLYAFPLQVKEDKLTKIDPQFLSKVESRVNESLSRLLNETENQGWLNSSEGLKAFKKKQLERYEKLVGDLGDIGFDNTFKKLHPNRLNKKAREKLKEYYHDKPDYLELLKNLDNPD